MSHMGLKQHDKITNYYKHYAPLELEKLKYVPITKGRRLRVNESIRSLVRNYIKSK
jgi:hypothetical protein